MQTERPYRIYDAKTKKNLPHRCYKHLHNAHIGALIQCRWAHVSTTLEVIDSDHGDCMGQYTRGVKGITFTKTKE